jgi:DNA-binding response OmpR family regulator
MLAWVDAQSPRVPLRVLVVEDDAELLDVLATALGMGGCSVYPVADADEGRAVLGAWRPDVLVLDLQGTGDAEALARAATGVPLVLTSGSSAGYLEAARARLGAAAAVAKPYSLKDLEVAIRGAVGYAPEAKPLPPRGRVDPRHQLGSRAANSRCTADSSGE